MSRTMATGRARPIAVALLLVFGFVPIHAPAPARAASLGPLLVASVDSAGAVAAPAPGHGPEQSGEDRVSMSDDGRYVAFLSWSASLVPGDTNAERDVFVRDLTAGTTERVSVSSLGAEADFYSVRPELSGGGRYVAFGSFATNLVPGDTNGPDSIYENPDADIFVFDRQTDTMERVSVSDVGVESNGHSQNPSISADGRYVAFMSMATNLAAITPGSYASILVHDRLTHTTRAIPNAVSACPIADNPSITADGSVVAYMSRALPDCFSTGPQDIYTYDFTTGITELISVPVAGTPIVGGATFPSISADGRYVSFEAGLNVYLRDRTLGQTELVSRASGGGIPELGSGYYPAYSHNAEISADGRYVAFESWASDLVAADHNDAPDIFVRDRLTGTTVKASSGADGLDNPACSGCDRNWAGLAGNGSAVAFTTEGALLSADTNGSWDVYVRDLRGAATDATSGTPGAGGTTTTDPEADGASPSDPIETSVTTPIAGSVSIAEAPLTAAALPPYGYAFLDTIVTIEAPIASAGAPLRVEFVIDPLMHGGLLAADIVAYRNGVPIADCDPARPNLAAAVPDPCVASRSGGGTDDARLTVLTSHASTWNLGFVGGGAPVALPFSGFFQPVDNGALNRAKAGSSIPVKFSLGGDLGLAILAGPPLVTQVACPGLPVDAIETTAAATASTLGYDAASRQYTYVLRTSKTWAGTCRRLDVRLIDRTSHIVDFQFTR
ncbi:MAG: PxKF domain-containing protein [Candidatus Limnocylindrales bacterium]